MQIALSSDEWHPINLYVKQWLIKQGHKVQEFGAYVTQRDESWVDSTLKAAESVTTGQCDEGIFFCWSGTGACLAANKIKGIRATLCWDTETTKLARIWNHPNVLVLSNRIMTESLADEILATWFDTFDSAIGLHEIKKLHSM